MSRREADSPSDLVSLVPPELQHAARILLTTPVPMALWWSDQWCQLTNSGFAAAIGVPSLPVGRPAEQCWPAGWEVLGPGARAVAAESSAVVLHDVVVPGADGVSPVWSVQFAPVPPQPGADPDGAAPGVLGVVLDRTEQVLAHTLERQAAEETASNLQSALASNRRIGTAIGILMAHRRITDTAAFELLRLASQHTHRKLRDIAEDVVLTGALPGD